jgi:acyl-CoA oxidase
VDVFTTFEGDNTVLLQLVAKTLLTNYREAFGDMDALGTVRFLADQLVESVIERTNALGMAQRLVDAAPGREEQTSLLDRDYQLALFAWREKHLLDTLARRLRAGLSDDQGDEFETFNATQAHLLAAASAHVDRIVLESFDAAVKSCDDHDIAALLDDVCNLHALSTLERDRAWFLEHGRLTAARSKAVIATVNALCGRLRPFAATLVDAFGIPEHLVAVPAASRSAFVQANGLG